MVFVLHEEEMSLGNGLLWLSDDDVHHVMIIIATSQQPRIGVLRGGT